jgi:hypothetical protein
MFTQIFLFIIIIYSIVISVLYFDIKQNYGKYLKDKEIYLNSKESSLNDKEKKINDIESCNLQLTNLKATQQAVINMLQSKIS